MIQNRKHILFTTCRRWPELFQADLVAAKALEKKGFRVSAAEWNDGTKPFQTSDLVVLRANWDYHYDPKGFIQWLDGIEERGIPLRNPVSTVKQNLFKTYLMDLEAAGISVPRSKPLKSGQDPLPLFDALGLDQAVVKPLIGASGHRVRKLSRQTARDWMSEKNEQNGIDNWLVQEFLPQIEQTGELSIIFFNGDYSHAILKQPRKGEFRVNSQYNGRLSRTYPDTELIRQAKKALDTIDPVPLYARIDGVVRDNEFILCEMELNEPGLYFDLAPDGADRFADAVLSVFYEYF